jgi:hypothetical protein
MHAFELLAEIGPAGAHHARELCDWLDAHSRPDGGLPFALAITDPAGCAPWWLDPDTTTSSLQMTAQVAANATLVARRDAAVRDHPWLARATRWCLDAIAALDEAPHAYELLFALRFLDAAAPVEAEADALLDRVRRFVPADGVVPVAGGVVPVAGGVVDAAVGRGVRSPCEILVKVMSVPSAARSSCTSRLGMSTRAGIALPRRTISP